MALYLTEAQKEYVDGLAQQLPAEQRDVFFGAVQTRLDGKPDDIIVARVASLAYGEIRRHEILKRRFQPNQEGVPR
jgi:hypothetical protein